MAGWVSLPRRPSDDDTRRSLQEGDEVAGRYRVVRHLGSGGMGEVYEVHDAALESRVALKIVRSKSALQPATVERFKKEILLSRSLTHRNICRVFEFGVHWIGGRDIPFFTMELLCGRTLSDHLAAEGPLTLPEALDLLRQIAEGLAAAHAAGIVHRDLKPSNVLLIPEGSGTRAVLSDFGLASRIPTDSVEVPPGSGTDGWCTPDYAAPEQLVGEAVTPAADLYALGVILFEMVCGRLPFGDADTGASALDRIALPAPAARTVVRRLHPRWDAAIARCLERAPEKRFRTPLELLEALDPRATPPAGRDPPPGPVVRLAKVLLLLGALFAGDRALRRRPPPARSRPVAVLELEDRSAGPEAAWLASAAQLFLTAALEGPDGAAPLPGLDTLRLGRQPGPPSTAGASPGLLARIDRELGAELVVAGAYSVAGPDGDRAVRLTAHLQDARSGALLGTVEEAGPERRLGDLLEAVGAKLRAAAGLPERDEAPAGADRAELPATPRGLRLYAEALRHLERDEWVLARDGLLGLTALEPRFAPGHSALADAFYHLGYDRRASAEAEQALATSGGLPRPARLWIEAGAHVMNHRGTAAIETYRTLFTLAPRCRECGLRLVDSLRRGNRPKDSLEEVARLERFRGVLGDDGRIDLAEAWSARAVPDFARAEQAAERARATAAARGAPLLVAEALEVQATVASDQSQLDRANELYRRLEVLYGDAGDERGRASALMGQGAVLRARGDLGGARRIYLQALAEWRRNGFARGIAATSNNLAGIDQSEGDLEGAKRAYEQALAIYEETDDRVNAATTLLNLAQPLGRLGRLAESRRVLERSRTLLRSIGQAQFEAIATANLAEVELAAGNASEALDLLDESLQTLERVGDPRRRDGYLRRRGAALLALGRLAESRRTFEQALAAALRDRAPSQESRALVGLGLVARAEGRLAEARRQEEQAVEMSRPLGGLDLADSEMALAEVELAGGRFARAEKLIAEARKRLPASDRDTWGQADLLLARTALERRSLTTARAALERGLAVTVRSESAGLRFDGLLLLARFDLATGHAERARTRLLQVLPEIRLHKLAPRELETLLLLGRATEALGDRARGRADLDAVARTARASHHELLAREARTAAGRLYP